MHIVKMKKKTTKSNLTTMPISEKFKKNFRIKKKIFFLI